MDIYEELGVKKAINAAGTYTVVGASRMAGETLEAMRQAAASYVMLDELQKAVHERVAKLTHNEAAYVCNSGSAALYLSAAAFTAHKAGRPFRYIDRHTIEKGEMLALWHQHIPYDYAIEQLGVNLRFLGYPTVQGAAGRSNLEMAISEDSIGVYFAPRTPRGFEGPGRLNLEDVIEIAHGRGLPVLVDAAAQLPPKSNLWEYTKMGADLVVFSGGKDLAGPQASGLVVGKKAYINLMDEAGFPNYGVGRMMKIGREEICALYVAIRRYMEHDEGERLCWCEGEIETLKRMLAGSGLYWVRRVWPNQAGQPLPRGFVEMPDAQTAQAVCDRLKECDPSVFCFTENQNGIYINPMCLKDGDVDYIAAKLLEIERSMKDVEG